MEHAQLPSTRQHLLIALMIGATAGALCWWIQTHLMLDRTNDFIQVLAPARALLSGGNPFAQIYKGYVAYPLTAALLGLPFVGLSPLTGASLLIGISSGLLAYQLRGGPPWRLLIFCSFPFCYAVFFAQYTPLITALALAGCAPLAMLIKPQNALPLLLTQPSRRWSFVAAGLIVAGSLILRPAWPWEWLAQLGHYQSEIPILIIPGPLLILALLCWRRREARLLVLMACFPQRAYYDIVALWIVPQTRSGMLVLTLTSWLALIFPQLPLMITACYLPALGVLMWEQRGALRGLFLGLVTRWNALMR